MKYILHISIILVITTIISIYFIKEKFKKRVNKSDEYSAIKLIDKENNFDVSVQGLQGVEHFTDVKKSITKRANIATKKEIEPYSTFTGAKSTPEVDVIQIPLSEKSVTYDKYPKEPVSDNKIEPFNSYSGQIFFSDLPSIDEDSPQTLPKKVLPISNKELSNVEITKFNMELCDALTPLDDAQLLANKRIRRLKEKLNDPFPDIDVRF